MHFIFKIKLRGGVKVWSRLLMITSFFYSYSLPLYSLRSPLKLFWNVKVPKMNEIKKVYDPYTWNNVIKGMPFLTRIWTYFFHINVWIIVNAWIAKDIINKWIPKSIGSKRITIRFDYMIIYKDYTHIIEDFGQNKLVQYGDIFGCMRNKGGRQDI